MARENRGQRIIFALPFLVSVYPVLSLLAANLDEVAATEAVRPLLVMLVGSYLLFFILRWILKDTVKAALISSFIVIMLLSYGHIYLFVKSFRLGDFIIGRHRYLIPIWIGLIGLIIWRIIKAEKIRRSYVQLIIGMTLVALAFPFIQVVVFHIRQLDTPPSMDEISLEDLGVEIQHGQELPDVYYIILDGYPREDVLLEEYEYDNSTFLRALEDLGFYIAEESRCNYTMTILSLTASLNMAYIDSLIDKAPSDPSITELSPLLRHNLVRRIFEAMDYQIVAFESGVYFTELYDADIYLSSRVSALSEAQGFHSLSPFEAMLIQNSIGRMMLDGTIAIPKILDQGISVPYRLHRERILYALDRLGEVPNIEGPKFVFAHINSPHPPFVFGPEGEEIENTSAYTLKADLIGWDVTDRDAAYVNQVIFLNSKIIPALEQIIDGSQVPPIVIIQADHGGFYLAEAPRMKILNAYHLPRGGSEDLYEQISPVNTFRVIFNRYFGAHFVFLDDNSYFSQKPQPFDFKLISP